ncbi:RNHCP domain-containing protein [Nocardioides agariphilus]|uniref:RNHCP domain-containing protein n=1 Tax=Nocardioides agariphilus TaxID=433664 RepID=A0A930VQ96_9ACTN|nr:RNHCP domain-containing protein [Nocardioides agariphilus]
MAFTRKVEDFDCVVCGAHNRGDGYTNHCSDCLCSRHVDVDPGDRAEDCAGVMRPVGVEVVRGSYVIVHRCERCGVVRRCKANARDDNDAIHEVMRTAAERALREGRRP